MLYNQGCSPAKNWGRVGVPAAPPWGPWLLRGQPANRGGRDVRRCLHRVKERHHRGRPNSSSESSAKHSRHASERRKSPSPSPGQRSSSWSSSGSLSKSRSRSREKRAGRSRSRSPSPKKPASRSAPGELWHGGRVPATGTGFRKGVTGHCWPQWPWGWGGSLLWGAAVRGLSLHPTRNPSPHP